MKSDTYANSGSLLSTASASAPWPASCRARRQQGTRRCFVAPCCALRRRLGAHRLRTCTARAHARHRSVLCARALHPSWSSCACTDGPGMESELISSTARARQGARRKERVSRWQMGRLLGADRSPARAANVGRSLHGHQLAGLGSPSASPPWRARFKARGERGAQVEGKWKDCWEQICPPTRLEPAAAGRRRARARGGERGLDQRFEQVDLLMALGRAP